MTALQPMSFMGGDPAPTMPTMAFAGVPQLQPMPVQQMPVQQLQQGGVSGLSGVPQLQHMQPVSTTQVQPVQQVVPQFLPMVYVMNVDQANQDAPASVFESSPTASGTGEPSRAHTTATTTTTPTTAPSSSFASTTCSDEDLLRVSRNTQVSGLAGAIAKRLRNRKAFKAEAMGPLAVAQAMRALKLARLFLQKERLSLEFHSEFMYAVAKDGEGAQHPGLRFSIKPIAATPTPQEGEELRVTEMSEPGKTAGAISKLARTFATTQTPITIVFGPSPHAINIAAKAFTLARSMLKSDLLDIRTQPCFDGPTREDPSEQILRFVISVVDS